MHKSTKAGGHAHTLPCINEPCNWPADKTAMMMNASLSSKHLFCGAFASQRPKVRASVSRRAAVMVVARKTKKEALLDAKKDVEELIKSKHCNPIVVRLAWHDSGSYDKVGQIRLPCMPGHVAQLCIRTSLDKHSD